MITTQQKYTLEVILRTAKTDRLLKRYNNLSQTDVDNLYNEYSTKYTVDIHHYKTRLNTIEFLLDKATRP